MISSNKFKIMLGFVSPLLLLLLLCNAPLNGQENSYIKFENGQTKEIKAFSSSKDWIHEDLWVETDFDTDGDGKLDRMHVSVTRPMQTETEKIKLPVVYATSPYFAGVSSDGKSIFWDVKHEIGETPPSRKLASEIPYKENKKGISNSYTKTWIPLGYIVVHSSSPGTGLSDGSPTVGGENEALAPKAVIEWLGGKDNGYSTRDGDDKVEAYWSTGNVGMIGVSYNGTLPIAAATTGVENLKAIIPVAPNTSYYHYYRANGLVRSPGGYLGEDVDVLFDFIHSGDPSKRSYARKVYRDSIMKHGMDRITGDYNDFWAGRDYLNHMDHFKAALFMSHGFNDWNVMPEHSYRIYKKAQELGVPCQIYYHQDGHGGHPPIQLMNKWFTRYLHGLENGVENDPKSWIVREGEKQEDPTSYPEYPHPDAKMVTYYPSGDGNQIGLLTTSKPNYNLQIDTIIDNVTIAADEMAQMLESDHRLLFATQPLTSDVHISGIGKIKISVSSDQEAVNLSAYLVSLPWNNKWRTHINENIISRAWADPQNHKSIWESEKLVPGEFYDLEFEFQPDDQIIPAGQQIGLMIFSSDKDFTLWPKPGTQLHVDLSKTSITLPVVD